MCTSSSSQIDIKAILNQHGIRLKKSLGQNFLYQPAWLRRIVDAAELPHGAAVLEIGAGLGTLTRELAFRADAVTAIEIDGRLLPALREQLAGFENVEVIQADILETDLSQLNLSDGYFVVANIPYYITSAVLRHLLEAGRKPSRVVLTVQEEVAERITAEDGKMSLLALSVQVYGKPRIALRIPASAFYPNPKVDSAVFVIDIYPQPVIPAQNLALFFRLAKAGFAQKRKMLRNSLGSALRLDGAQVDELLSTAGIKSERRAETLALAEWRTLCSVVAERNN